MDKVTLRKLCVAGFAARSRLLDHIAAVFKNLFLNEISFAVSMAQLYCAVPCLAGPWFAMPWLGLPCLLLQQSAVTSPDRVRFAVTHGIQECRGNCTFHKESQSVQFPSQRRFCEQKKKRKVGLPPFQLGIQTRDRFPSLLQNVVLGSFKSFRPIRSPSYYYPLSHIAHCTPLCWDIDLLDT